jgi:chromosome segregation ATPase
MHRKLAADNRQKELKSQLDNVKAELEEALAAKEELASDLVYVQNEKVELEKESAELTQQIEATTNSDSTIGELRSVIQLKDQEINRMKTAFDEYKEESQKESHNLDEELKTVSQKLKEDHELSQTEIERVKTALREANEAMHKLRSGLSPKARPSLRSPSSPIRRTPTNFTSNSSVRFQTEPLDPSSAGVTLDNSIADRLAKMRDSAERAHLIRSHKREMSRLTLDKEAEIKKMVTAHEEAMRKALKQADSKMNSRLDELKKTLTEEYEERLDEVESRHNQKFAEVSGDVHVLFTFGPHSVFVTDVDCCRVRRWNKNTCVVRKLLTNPFELLYLRWQVPRSNASARLQGVRHWKDLLISSITRQIKIRSSS